MKTKDAKKKSDSLCDTSRRMVEGNMKLRGYKWENDEEFVECYKLYLETLN